MKRPSLIHLASLAALLAPLGASADVVPLVNNINSASSAGAAFTWAYNLELAAEHEAGEKAGDDNVPAGPAVSSQDLRHASFLTIFDFAGYVAGSCTSASGWACRAQTLGFTPSQVPPKVDAATALAAPVARVLPEPGSLALASVALLLLGGSLRRRA